MEIRTTTCPRDCPDACRIRAHVEDGRVVRLSGDPAHPITRGFLCHRTGKFLARHYDPERLTSPLRRRTSGFEPVSWGEALDEIAATLTRIRDESGPLSILQYRSGGSLGILTSLVDRFFQGFGPVTTGSGSICNGAGEAAQELDFGEVDASQLADLDHAQNIVLWGKNCEVSSPHLLPILRRRREAGAGITLIDPVWHETAKLADFVVQPRPGGDAALALAVVLSLAQEERLSTQGIDSCDGQAEFFALVESRSLEEWCRDADVTAAEVRSLAARFAQGPTTVLVGWGMGRRINGGAIIRAIDALCAVTGNLGVRGAGASFYYKRRGAFDSLKLPNASSPRVFPEPLLGSAIRDAKDPPIRAVWVTHGNPVVMLPGSEVIRRALESRELSVVVDTHMTDTARAATFVLPTTTMLEATDVVGSYGHHYMGLVDPVVDAPEGVRTDLWILQELARRVGLSSLMEGTEQEWRTRALATAARLGVTEERLRHEAIQSPVSRPVLFAGRRFPTLSGRMQLTGDAGSCAPDDPDYPLVLHSLSTPLSQSSQWVRLPEGPLTARVHPDATTLADGSPATLESRLGKLHVVVKHDPRQRRDVVIVPKGGHLSRGQAANAIIRPALSDLGEGGALYDERVRLVLRSKDEPMNDGLAQLGGIA